MMKNISILMLQFSLCLSAEASLKCSSNGTNVYYINGVWVGEDEDVQKSASAIYNNIYDLRNSIDQSEKHIGKQVFPVHNISLGKIMDIKELDLQADRNFLEEKERQLFYQNLLKDRVLKFDAKILDQESFKRYEELTTSALSLIHKKRSFDQPPTRSEIIAEKEMLDKIKNEINQIRTTANQILELAEADRVTVNLIKEKIVSAIQDNKKVIFVSHSQGNEVLRTAYNELSSDPSQFGNDDNYNKFKKVFGTMQVAVPVSGLITDNRSQYVTMSRDLVVWGAQIFLFREYVNEGSNYEVVEIERDGWRKIWDYLPGLNLVFDLFDTTLFHGMEDAYLNPKIKARSIGSTGDGQPMNEIFNEHMIKVAESLEDNCENPVIEISNPLLEIDSGTSKNLINSFAGSDVSVDLFLTDSNTTYDSSKTAFSWNVQQVNNNSIYQTVSGDSLIIPMRLPYNDLIYRVTIEAENVFGKRATKKIDYHIKNNRPPVLTAGAPVCSWSETANYADGTANVEISVDDDSLKLDGFKFTVGLPYRAVNYPVSLPDHLGAIGYTAVSNSCERTPIKHEVWGMCQLGGPVGVDCNVTPRDPKCDQTWQTGVQFNELRVYSPGSNLYTTQPLSHGYEGGEGIGYFTDPNDPTLTISYPTSGLCKAGTQSSTNPWIRIQ